MRRLLFAAAVIALSVTAVHAADYAVMLNEQERAALLDLLDELTKARGNAIAGRSLYFDNKLRTAPVVTERKDEEPKEKAQ